MAGIPSRMRQRPTQAALGRVAELKIRQWIKDMIVIVRERR
jgi:hypothetical protein